MFNDIVQWRAAIGGFNRVSSGCSKKKYFNAYSCEFQQLKFLPIIITASLLVLFSMPFLIFFCSLMTHFPLLKKLSSHFDNLDQLIVSSKNSYLIFYLSLIFILKVVYHCTMNVSLTNTMSLRGFIVTCRILLPVVVLIFRVTLLLRSGDIETNPGPTNTNLAVAHWNLNGLASHKFVKVPLLEAYMSFQNIDVMFLSETFLNSSTNDELELSIEGYQLERIDHPNDEKQGGVCVFYKEQLNLRIRKDLCKLRECIICELEYRGKKCLLMSLYRSPSQSSDEFSTFIQNFETTMNLVEAEQPYIYLILGDFNGRCSNWWPEDVDNKCGVEIDSLTSFHGLSQLIDCPTHILPQSSTCIDLIFCSLNSLVKSSGVHPSLFHTCHHQITYVNLDFHTHSPPPYQRKTWDYARPDKKSIQRSLSLVNWEVLFSRLDVNSQVLSLNNVLLNIFENFIPNRTITCNSKEPPWITKEIKNAYHRKSRAFNNFNRRGRKEFDRVILDERANEYSNLINMSKERYLNTLGEKLNDPLLAPKTYWAILNRFLGKRKIPLLSNNRFVVDFEAKAGIFNDFFANQCRIINNSSLLPPLSYVTDSRLDTMVIYSFSIKSILKSLNPNKAHGWDNISVKMIKLCGDEIVIPLEIIFKNCIDQSIYPSIWKRANVAPVHKKASKNDVNNYRPIYHYFQFSAKFSRN